MGSQIQIAQSLFDEGALLEALGGRCRLLALPWSWTSPALRPAPPADVQSLRLVLFLETDAAAVVSRIRAIPDEPGTLMVSPKEGLCIEWWRTERKGHAAVPGRFYAEPATLASAERKKLWSLIGRTIKQTYVKATGDRFPVYVGPDLAEHFSRKTAFLSYPDGTPRPTLP